MAVEFRVITRTALRADNDAPGVVLRFDSRSAALAVANAINSISADHDNSGIDFIEFNPGNLHLDFVFSSSIPGLNRLTASRDATGFLVTLIGYNRVSNASTVPAVGTPANADQFRLFDTGGRVPLASVPLVADPVPGRNNNGKVVQRHGAGPRVAGVMAPRTSVENRPRTADGRQKIGTKARVSVSTPLGYKTPTLNRGR